MMKRSLAGRARRGLVHLMLAGSAYACGKGITPPVDTSPRAITESITPTSGMATLEVTAQLYCEDDIKVTDYKVRRGGVPTSYGQDPLNQKFSFEESGTLQTGCDDGVNPTVWGLVHNITVTQPPQPSYSQTAEVVNNVDINSSVTLTNLEEASLVYHKENGDVMATRTITASTNETFTDAFKGSNYLVLSAPGLAPDTAIANVTNYKPTMNLGGFETDFNERDSLMVDLESRVDDINPEDPVPIASVTSLRGDVEATFSGYILKIKGNSPGTYEVEVRAGSEDGGFVTGVVRGEVLVVLPAEDQIAFFGRRDGDWEIYTMNADGSGQTRLTKSPGEDFHPVWSPNGSKIVFMSQKDGNREIYTMNADGSGQTNLSQSASDDDYPSWSPDGSKIVFQSDRDLEGFGQIYVMNADGSGQTNLSNVLGARDKKPSWSPDGNFIAFYTFISPSTELMVMNADGSNQRILTDSFEHEDDGFSPRWSPDSSKILFTRSFGSDTDIIVINRDGEETNLSNNSTFDTHPKWSPDGTEIVFSSNRFRRPGKYDIFKMNADGSGETRLTDEGGVVPSWSPDGNWIAFMNNPEPSNRFEIYVMKEDGSSPTRLTFSLGDENNPVWRPKQ